MERTIRHIWILCGCFLLGFWATHLLMSVHDINAILDEEVATRG